MMIVHNDLFVGKGWYFNDNKVILLLFWHIYIYFIIKFEIGLNLKKIFKNYVIQKKLWV